MTENGIVWQDPPPRKSRSEWRRGPGAVQRLVSQLREHPGKWALVYKAEPTNVSGQANRAARLYQLGCKVRQRRHDDSVDVYACWPEDAA